MPEVLLCCYCKRSINKHVYFYVVLRQAGDRYPKVRLTLNVSNNHLADLIRVNGYAAFPGVTVRKHVRGNYQG